MARHRPYSRGKKCAERPARVRDLLRMEQDGSERIIPCNGGVEHLHTASTAKAANRSRISIRRPLLRTGFGMKKKRRRYRALSLMRW